MNWLNILIVLVSMCFQYGEFSAPQNITSSPCADINHLFLAPGVLTAGGSNRACVSRFHPDGPAKMELTLISDDQNEAASYRELPPGDGGCIDIAVPQKPNTKAKLVVSLWYPEAKCSWQRELTVAISSGRVVVAHTERARYRPGDTLRARVVVLKADLAPAHGAIDEVWLEGPPGAWEGARAAQWFSVRTRMGVAQLQHELTGAPPGRWTLRAKMADGAQGSAVFWVGNYELPPFQLSVRHAPRVLRTSERLVWTVCVRYPWTEAVEGMLVIRIRGAGGTTVAQEASSSIKTVVRIKAPRACHRHAAAARRIGLNGTNPPDVVVADFSFQEDGTRIWQNTTVVSQVVDSPISLEFLTKHRVNISPGLPYKLKVKATRWDDKPAANERVKVCRIPGIIADMAPSAINNSCHEALTDDRGVARVLFTASGADEVRTGYYNFLASLSNDSSISVGPLYIAAQFEGSVHAALGPIRPEANSGRTFVPLYVNVRNVTKPLTVHFVVVTRGGIIYRWGATTQCPQTSSSDYIPTTSRNTNCYHAYTANPNLDTAHSTITNLVKNLTLANGTVLDGNDPDSLLDRHMLRVMLPIKVTHQMCPDSHLVAYFYYNGELVSASKQFEMDECFSNKVEATWLSRQVAPGSTASLRIVTPGPALCALTVLDSASKWNQPGPTVKEVVMSGLRRLMDSHRNLTEYEAAGACFLTSAEMSEVPTNNLELTASWLAAAGVRITGGNMGINSYCVSPPEPMIEETTVPRSDFSEAWLWRLVGVGSNGSAVVSAKAPDSISRFEASAVCLARTGIAISQPAVLQVFREFFIHADSPRRLKRGDATIVRYRLFNYLYEPLSVQIQILTDARLEGPIEHVESACVSARASVARRVEIRAKLVGDARLSIRAKSVRDRNCANGTTARTSASDEVIINITVDPEGVPVQDHKSILLCGRGSVESSQSQVSWNWPPIQSVPETESLTLWAVGDVTGPLLADADSLVTLPRGCGEQNMARLATNLLALMQLDATSPAAASAKAHVARGFTRQLQYVHPAGGFSAFGAADASPSTWLTAFALKYMRRAHQILTPGLPVPPVLERAERWLLDQQMENGCFRNEGQVFHRELRGGLNEEGEIASVALTAYVITALVESTAPLPARVLHNTLSCLRALPPMKTRTSTGVYAHALLGYTFMRLRTYEDELRKSNEASLLWDSKEAIGAGLKEEEELRELVELLKLARRNGDYVWWETSSLSTSIEATAYALLALSYCPPALRATTCAVDARAATRWLSSHRNFAGGFLSTQDTLVALEALTTWSTVQPTAPTNLTVKARSGSDIRKVTLHPGVKVPDIVKMGVGGQLDVAVEGTGCALIQATRSYHSTASDQDKDKLLSVQVSVTTDGSFDCDVNGTSCFCAAVVEACVVWAGAFPDMAVLELSLPSGFGADAARLYSQLQPSNMLLRRIELAPNGGRATLYLGPRSGAGGEGGARGGHACFRAHGVGPRARTKPAHVRVIDYYTPTLNDTQMYTIPEDCPARITHESPEYHSSDNLFTKSKSLNQSGEILITHEFSFEDIPDGIPLEDPVYDTLNRDDIAYLSKFNEVQTSRKPEEGENDIVNFKPENIEEPSTEMYSEFTQVITKELDKSKTDNNAEKEPVHNITRKGKLIPFNDYLGKNYYGDDFRIPQSDYSNHRFDFNETYFNYKSMIENNKALQNETLQKPVIASQKNDEPKTQYVTTNKPIVEINYEESNKMDVKYNHNSNANPFVEEKDDLGIFDYANPRPITEESKTDVSNSKPDQEMAPNSPLTIQEENKPTPSEDPPKPSSEVPNEASPSEILNPNLASFHIIDTQRDLEVPTGLEGPVPAVVLPPQNFVAVPPPPGFQPQFSIEGYPRGLPTPSVYYQPPYRQDTSYRPYDYGYRYGRLTPPAG
ncbi:hypothetical protein ABMA28_006553 [Loxostege sticticalis]|uniref:Alpha-2-macroglobulin n=1 Tax=Loxostege sticticalis TaxID=481309 RepID=A0ABD0SNW2_LOXSC